MNPSVFYDGYGFLEIIGPLGKRQKSDKFTGKTHRNQVRKEDRADMDIFALWPRPPFGNSSNFYKIHEKFAIINPSPVNRPYI